MIISERYNSDGYKSAVHSAVLPHRYWKLETKQTVDNRWFFLRSPVFRR